MKRKKELTTKKIIETEDYESPLSDHDFETKEFDCVRCNGGGCVRCEE